MLTQEKRINIAEVDAGAHKAVIAMETYVNQSGLDTRLRELIKIRASQVNGCAYCLDMHVADARRQGESQARLDVLSAWREAPNLFSEKERALLALTEAVTLIPGGVSQEVWDDAAEHFDERELVHILMAISAINVWNRLAIATAQQPAAH